MLRRILGVPAVVLGLVYASSAPADAAPLVQQISADPYTVPPGQHATEVEPDSFSFGSTIVTASQVGRIFDGGSTNIGFSTSTDGGQSWISGFLPGITTAAGGTFDRASDAAVAYDARHDVWMISTLAISNARGQTVLTSRSTDGGLTWGDPVTTAPGGGLDKNWIVCDNGPASPYAGNCYTEVDDNGAGNRIKMSTSTDGGLTWGPLLNTANNGTGLGGQPLVQPDGTVVVPIANGNITSILSFRSVDGGASWTATTLVSTVREHRVAGNLRTSPLPSAEIDGAGTVYVGWQDCRFRSGCSSNDIVLSASRDGVTWTTPRRVPIDPVASGIDHFIPGLGVDPTSSGATARLGLAFYYYRDAACSAATCQLGVGYLSSGDGGRSWSRPIRLGGPMSLSMIANTSQGRMVGDYISTSWSLGRARPVFAGARTPSGGAAFDEAIYTSSVGLPAPSVAGPLLTGSEPVLAGLSQRPSTSGAVTRH